MVTHPATAIAIAKPATGGRMNAPLRRTRRHCRLPVLASRTTQIRQQQDAVGTSGLVARELDPEPGLCR